MIEKLKNDHPPHVGLGTPMLHILLYLHVISTLTLTFVELQLVFILKSVFQNVFVYHIF